VSLGTDPNDAWTKATASVKTLSPELLERTKSGEPTPTASKDPGFRMEEEVKVYLSNVAKLAPKTHKAYKRPTRRTNVP